MVVLSPLAGIVFRLWIAKILDKELLLVLVIIGIHIATCFPLPLCNTISSPAVWCPLNICIDGVKTATWIVLSTDRLLYLTLVSLEL